MKILELSYESDVSIRFMDESAASGVRTERRALRAWTTRLAASSPQR